MNKFLINASNLHAGGGLQVAASFISEVAKLPEYANASYLWISSEVHKNILKVGCDLSAFRGYEIIDIHGMQSPSTLNISQASKFDAIFTIFGPLYWRPRGTISIVGFAQAWIAYPNNRCYKDLPLHERIFQKLKYNYQKRSFKENSDIIVVELEHVKKQIELLQIKSSRKIHIVRNTLSSIYFDRKLWSDFTIKKNSENIALGFLGRNYSHKNTKIIPIVKNILLNKYKISVDFYVTFSQKEWETTSEHMKSSVINVGALDTNDCPRFYEAMDGVFFPSLLECFSVTPLEAMAMKKPIFLADTAFNRDVCQNFGCYFNPLSPESAAQSIFDYYSSITDATLDSLESAQHYALNFSSPQKRAHSYLKILESAASEAQQKVQHED